MNEFKEKQADLDLGESIKYWRLKRKMSQSDLAEKIGLTYQQIQKYENGKNRVCFSRMVLIASHLGITVETLIPAKYMRINHGTDVVKAKIKAMEATIKEIQNIVNEAL